VPVLYSSSRGVTVSYKIFVVPLQLCVSSGMLKVKIYSSNGSIHIACSELACYHVKLCFSTFLTPCTTSPILFHTF
jgi:hypothetical protein